MPYKDGDYIKGVLIGKETVIWPKGDISGEESYPPTDKKVEIGEIRTDKNELIKIVITGSPLFGVAKMDVGDSVGITLEGPYYNRKGGMLSRDFEKQGTLFSTDRAHKRETPISCIMDPKAERTLDHKRDGTDWKIRTAIWNTLGGKISLQWANCAEVEFPDGSHVQDWGSKIDIVKPSVKAVDTALTVAKYHWGPSIQLEGSEKFLMSAYVLATDKEMRVENYGIENAQRGLVSPGLKITA